MVQGGLVCFVYLVVPERLVMRLSFDKDSTWGNGVETVSNNLRSSTVLDHSPWDFVVNGNQKR